MRFTLLALAASAPLALATPAAAQLTVGETGLTATVIGTYASDYLFRGISQTRSRMAFQASAEIEHTSGTYVGAFLSNVRFQGTDARQEVDTYGGYRFTLLDTKFDVGGIGYLYPGYNAAPGAASPVLDYFEGYLRASREFGPVNLMAAAFVSPNFFGRSGSAVYVEGGADWKTGIWDLTLGGRLGHQWIQRNAVFGTPDYAWWSVAVSREFALPGVGTITASVGYYDTSISRGDCIFGTRQDICGARALGALSFKF